ncbi:MAG: hypothetical protein EOP56_04115 [Sphingobacteriales bacterium]|nr:MAG: hypothetical protein EOP56_04115 [Sphingobacteriales bacterium]
MKRFILSLAMLLPVCLMAQPHHEVGLAAGIASYYGDLQDKWFPDYGTKPMGGILYKYFMNPHVGFRLGASYSRLTAADSLSESAVRRARNLRFETHIVEVHGGLEVNFLPIEMDRMKVSPYVFAGVGIFHFNPFTDAPDYSRVYLRPLGTEGQNIPTYPDRKEYKLVNVSFPIGGGLKFFIGNTIMLAPEIGFRYTNTDYLDDVSKSYVNMDTLGAYRGNQAVEYSFRTDERRGWDGNYPNYKYQRGDNKSNDWYWFGSLTATIYFPAFGNVGQYLQTHCPAFFQRQTR